MLPAVVAHRGASAHRAEHTLGAYALALDHGADALECDVRLTRDGHLVCVHDRRIDRTSTGRGKVSTLTLDRLAELDFHSWHTEDPEHADDLVRTHRTVVGRQPPGVLTLDALLGLVVDTSPSTRLFVETKHPVRYAGLVEDRLVELLGRFGLATPPSKDESRVVVMSFSARAVRRVRDAAPALPTVLLFSVPTPTRRSGVLPPSADYAGPSIAMLRNDPDLVARWAQRQHDTYCWTVDDPADVRLCQRLGVRYVATNYPARTRAVLAGRAPGTVAPDTEQWGHSRPAE